MNVSSHNGRSVYADRQFHQVIRLICQVRAPSEMHLGITDVICLMGFYWSVAMTMAFYDVPAGATGMAR